MTNSIQNSVKDALMTRLNSQGVDPIPEKREVIVSMFQDITEEDHKNKLEYSDITGHPHPSGNKYWFTKRPLS